MKTVLVTGAAGHVGQAFRRYYGDPAESGYRLRLTDRVAEIPAGPGQDVVVAELTDYDAVLAATVGVDAVVHLAADTRGAAPWGSVLPNNIEATYHVFEAAREAGVGKVVYASTHHVCGYALGEDGACGTPGLPAAPVRPDSLYAVSKAFAEALGRYYVDRFGMSVICLRIGSCHGGDDAGSQRPRARRMRESCAGFPYGGREHAGIWISNRDMAQLIHRSLEADVAYGIYYGASGNTPPVLDVRPAREQLGYEPQDDVSELLQS
ncbi:MAG: NAD(P)-dependent oxidoreductase [Anaerolineae bacterium]|nr:NAD(P)-dependent oxidoreductase [Anaerolineae bacterium]